MNPDDKKPDCFISFDWPKFQSATVGMRREHKWSYWNACCAYYWADCDGLENSDDYLRAVCECMNPADWCVTKASIFNGKFFRLENDGRWHQKRTREEYERAKEQIAKLHARAIAASSARWPKEDTEHAQAMLEDMHKDMLEVCPIPTPTPTDIPIPITTPSPTPSPTRLNDERLCAPQPASPHPAPNRKRDRSSSNRFEKALMGQLTELLGKDEMARAGGYWLAHWVRPHGQLTERAINELIATMKERTIDNPGAYLTDLLKRWSK